MFLAGFLALALASASVGAHFVLPPPVALLMSVLLGAAGVLWLILAVSGALVFYRQRRIDGGRTDLFLELARARSAELLGSPLGFRAGPIRRVIARVLLGHDLLVGDEVEVRPLAEILATLDEHGCLDGIPFQAEMAKYCGRRGHVFRCVDKIYDYGRTKQMRRLDDCVLVAGLRCDGADHGGCQALCYVIWKKSWLQRPGERDLPGSVAAGGRAIAPAQAPVVAADGSHGMRYACQFTALHAASRPMGAWGIGKELRPLIAGNITVGTFLVGLSTRLFNSVQSLRGGIGFPVIPPPADVGAAGAVDSLSVGDRVRVRPIEQIAKTLNKSSRNKGLHFDRDMVKHCGATHQVLVRVERIIDDANGEMRQMKTPCIVLAGVDYSSEFLNFNAQHDMFFWREAWLERLPD